MSTLFPLIANEARSTQASAVPSQTLVNIWVYFNLIPNTIFLPILVATFLFSKTATRHLTLINACMTWIFSGIISCLLFYAGQQFGREPSTGLCIAQASLVDGIMPMWSVAVLVLVYHMFVVINDDKKKQKLGTTKMCIMLAAPYITQFVFSLATLTLALQNPQLVNRSHRVLFCFLKHPPFTLAVSIFTFTVCIGITIIEGMLALTLYRNWRALRSVGRSGGVHPQFLLRVMAFGLYIFSGMTVSLLAMLHHSNIFSEMYLALAGTVILLIFGTQADVFRAWCFWRRHPPPQLVIPRSAPLDGSHPNWYDSRAKGVTDEEKTVGDQGESQVSRNWV
jgi:hypothetical protein